MGRIKTKDRAALSRKLSYGLVAAFYVIITAMDAAGMLKSSIRGMLVPVCVYMIMALSLNLTVGIMGDLSLGHAGFMGVGAFTGTAVAVGLDGIVVSPAARLLAGILAGAVCGALAGFIIGIPVLRLNGDYLAIVTLAFGEILKSIFNNIYLGKDGNGLHFCMMEDKLGLEPGGRYIIQGAMGIRNIPKTASFAVGIAMTLVTLFIIYNLVNSKTGRAIMAIRDNRIAAESVGIDVAFYKMTAFVTSAAIAGAAGALFGQNYSSLVASKFGFDTSILVLVFVVLGGQGSMLGSMTAAAALTVLPEALRGFNDYRMLVYALVLIIVMLIRNSAAFRMMVFNFRRKFDSEG